MSAVELCSFQSKDENSTETRVWHVKMGEIIVNGRFTGFRMQCGATAPEIYVDVHYPEYGQSPPLGCMCEGCVVAVTATTTRYPR